MAVGAHRGCSGGFRGVERNPSAVTTSVSLVNRQPMSLFASSGEEKQLQLAPHSGDVPVLDQLAAPALGVLIKTEPNRSRPNLISIMNA